MRSVVVLGLLALALVMPACDGEKRATETPGSMPFRIAVVMPSARNDVAFSQSMWTATEAVRVEMGGENTLQVAYSENVFIVTDAAAAIRDYAARGYDVVIAHGEQYAAAVREIAPSFLRSSFAYYGSTKDTFGLPNVFVYEASAEEGGYVNGVIAGRLSKSKRVGVIGPVQASDAETYAAGFATGVRATDASIRIDTVWTGSFSDVGLMRNAAKQLIDEGADVLTGSSQAVVGAIDAARARGKVLWLGTQSDQSPLAPELTVASVVYDFRDVVKELIANRRAGTLGGRTFSLHLANGGLTIAYGRGYSLDAEVKAAAEAAIEGIARGTIDPLQGAQH